jgi:hypothetical protein
MAANEFEKNFTALDAIRQPRRKRPPARAGSFSRTQRDFSANAKLGRYRGVVDIEQASPSLEATD